MAKWVTAEKAKAGLRHAVVCPNVTGRTKERIAQSKRARAGSLRGVPSLRVDGVGEEDRDHVHASTVYTADNGANRSGRTNVQTCAILHLSRGRRDRSPGHVR